MPTIRIVSDLRSMFGPVRDQAGRPTCLAFAASDSHAALRAGWIPLSCEFAFYHAQRRAGLSPHSGATLNSMLDALRIEGQPIEADWPYQAALPSDLRKYGPPADIGNVFRRNGARQTEAVSEIVTLLDVQKPVLVLLRLSDAFYSPDQDGVVDEVAGDLPDPVRRHAVVAVGHGISGRQRIVLVRNSWGLGWGLKGHGWLTEDFLVPRITRIASLTEEVNVSADRTAA